MKYGSHLLVAVLLLSCSPTRSKGQYKDYVVTQENDTIYGKLKLAISKLRLEHDGTISKFASQEIKSYYYARRDLLFRSLVLPKSSRPAWLLCIENGRINLYVAEDVVRNPGMNDPNGTVAFDYYYVQKDNSEVYKVKSSGLGGGGKKKKDLFRGLIADNPDVLSKLDASRSYSFKKIRKLVQLYNEEDKNGLSGAPAKNED